MQTFSTDPLPSLAKRLAGTAPEKFLAGLRRELKLSDPFWDRHCTFHSEELARPAAVLGADRAEILLIDVFAPALLAYAKLNGTILSEAKAAVLPQFIHAARNNRVFKNAVRRWLPEDDPRLDIFDNAAVVQGCLHIYKQYCSDCAGDCTACLLTHSIL